MDVTERGAEYYYKRIIGLVLKSISRENVVKSILFKHNTWKIISHTFSQKLLPLFM